MSAAIGVLVGTMVKLGMHLYLLHGRVTSAPITVNNESKSTIWLLTWPLIIGMVFSQAASLIDNLFASYMENGAIAALSYARKIVEMPIMVFPIF